MGSGSRLSAAAAGEGSSAAEEVERALESLPIKMESATAPVLGLSAVSSTAAEGSSGIGHLRPTPGAVNERAPAADERQPGSPAAGSGPLPAVLPVTATGAGSSPGGSSPRAAAGLHPDASRASGLPVLEDVLSGAGKAPAAVATAIEKGAPPQLGISEATAGLPSLAQLSAAAVGKLGPANVQTVAAAGPSLAGTSSAGPQATTLPGSSDVQAGPQALSGHVLPAAAARDSSPVVEGRHLETSGLAAPPEPSAAMVVAEALQILGESRSGVLETSTPALEGVVQRSPVAAGGYGGQGATGLLGPQLSGAGEALQAHQHGSPGLPLGKQVRL